MIFREDGSIWFRQSWLDTATRCGERGRFAITLPEWDAATSDSALIGTAAHAAIEAVLREKIPATVEAIEWEARTAALELCNTEQVKWTKYSTPGECAANAARCATAWLEGLFPDVQLGGHAEVQFEVPLFTRPNGRVVGITGTADYVDPPGTDYDITDWKTSARKFTQRDKQATAIQPTVYAAAAVNGGFSHVTDRKFEYPIRWRYGIMVRGERKATPQWVDVQRTSGSYGWLIDQLNVWVDMAEKMGVDGHWPRQDDHFLCSDRWCAWWSACKGARLSEPEVRWRGRS